MENQPLNDLKFDGSGSSSGGTFGQIKINGSGRILGDLTCQTFKINGSGHIQGSLDTDDGKINGTATIEGKVKARQFKINGTCQVKDGISGDDLAISGSATFGSIDVRQVRISGTAKVSGDCSTDHFRSEGTFEIGGLLNSDDIDIHLYHSKSKAREIGGSRIRVTLGTADGFNVLKAIFSLGINPTLLECDLIEGDDIQLENTHARTVRGRNVVIGKGCSIGLVEYSSSLTRSGDAKIGEERKDAGQEPG